MQVCFKSLTPCISDGDTLYNEPLEAVESLTYLGVDIQSIFAWETHLNNISTKAYRKLGTIKRLLNSVSRSVHKLAYITFCRLTSEYASDVWDPYFVKHVNQLEMVQR